MGYHTNHAKTYTTVYGNDNIHIGNDVIDMGPPWSSGSVLDSE